MNLTSGNNSAGASFLPEDYRRRKVEGRTGVLMVILFCIVMFGVVAAFFVTNREWSAVRALQEQINVQYAAEAKKIEQLKVLEAQKSEMVEKAEVTTSLIEKVPRSILMAEIINRMPVTLALTELSLTSKKIVDAPTRATKKKPAPRSISGKPAKGKAAAGAAEPETPPERPKPPRFEYTLTLLGLAKTDEEIADYTSSLQSCGLLERVEFKFSGDVIIDEVGLRKFRIEANIRPSADARAIEPLHVQRLDAGGTALEGATSSVLRGASLRQRGFPLPTIPPDPSNILTDPRANATAPENKE